MITGRLTAKPELKYTQSNNAVATFTVAVNRRKKQDGTQEADFINCRVWNKLAENLCQYQDKGNLILADGELRVERYQDNQGNNKYSTYVLVSNIEYLQSKQKNESIEETHDNMSIFEDFGEQVNIDGDFLD